MPKAAILVGIAGSKRKFIAGQMSELCFYLRIDGVEISESTCFAPHWQILGSLNEDLCDYAKSVQKELVGFVRYHHIASSAVYEFIICNGWRNNFETGEDVRCQPLPIQAIDVFRNELIACGLREAKK